MSIYEQETAVTLTNSEWLRVTIALFDAIDAMENRGATISARDSKEILEKIRVTTETILDAAHKECMEELKAKKIIEEEKITIDEKLPF